MYIVYFLFIFIVFLYFSAQLLCLFILLLPQILKAMSFLCSPKICVQCCKRFVFENKVKQHFTLDTFTNVYTPSPLPMSSFLFVTMLIWQLKFQKKFVCKFGFWLWICEKERESERDGRASSLLAGWSTFTCPLKGSKSKKKLIMTFFCHDTNVRYFNSVLFALSSWISGPDFMSTESFYLEVKWPFYKKSSNKNLAT